MAKSLSSNQTEKINAPHIYPIYLVHILDVDGETLYFSDRCFRYNNHDYEDYLTRVDRTALQMEKMGGYLNMSARLWFKNQPFRAYDYLSEFFAASPITRKEMELYVLYHKTSETYGSDVSTKLYKASIGKLRDLTISGFSADLSSILHSLDNKSPFVQIQRTNWPNASPDAIGKYENIWYGSLRDVPCHCVLTGAASPLFLDLAVSGETYVTLSDVDYPIAFPNSGVVQIDQEKISYSAKDSVNKRLTISSRAYGGTTAAIHKRSTPVWEVLASYKYLAAAHPMKAINVVYAGEDRIRIGSSNYTLNLDDGGKTTITFTERQIQKVLQIISSVSNVVNTDLGSHSHTALSTTIMVGYSSDYNETVNFNEAGAHAYMRDQDDSSYKRASADGTVGEGNAIFEVAFSGWPGSTTPDAVYLCITFAITMSGASASVTLTSSRSDSENLGDTSGNKITSKFLSGSTNPATWLKITAHHGGAGHIMNIYVFEMWLEVQSSETDASPATGLSTTVNTTVTSILPAPDVIDPLILADGDGYKDDGSGTYTGTPSALIENPSDVRRHMLVALWGRLMAEIGASFTTLRATYAARIAGGYKFGMIVSRIGLQASEIFRRLDEMSRSNLREDGGKFELAFNDTADPATVLTIDNANIKGIPVFNEDKTLSEIKDKIRAGYDLDWSGMLKDLRYGNYKKQTERGTGTLIDDIEYPAIQVQAMAEDVADWHLLQKEAEIPTVALRCDHSARILERGDWFLLRYLLHDNTKWKVLEIEEDPVRQEFQIQAIKFVS